MSDPWVLSSASGNNVVLGGLDLAPGYYAWFAKNMSRFNGGTYLSSLLGSKTRV